ncbi:MAG TPA: hypothetical protein P5052_01890 [Candidatus Paceibacterota bacterium]|nr:hypothetical protein [Candidatus Paceibacterota bacterium]
MNTSVNERIVSSILEIFKVENVICERSIRSRKGKTHYNLILPADTFGKETILGLNISNEEVEFLSRNRYAWIHLKFSERHISYFTRSQQLLQILPLFEKHKLISRVMTSYQYAAWLIAQQEKLQEKEPDVYVAKNDLIIKAGQYSIEVRMPKTEITPEYSFMIEYNQEYNYGIHRCYTFKTYSNSLETILALADIYQKIDKLLLEKLDPGPELRYHYVLI